jgi:hypothetical protein
LSRDTIIDRMMGWLGQLADPWVDGVTVACLNKAVAAYQDQYNIGSDELFERDSDLVLQVMAGVRYEMSALGDVRWYVNNGTHFTTKEQGLRCASQAHGSIVTEVDITGREYRRWERDRGVWVERTTPSEDNGSGDQVCQSQRTEPNDGRSVIATTPRSRASRRVRTRLWLRPKS